MARATTWGAKRGVDMLRPLLVPAICSLACSNGTVVGRDYDADGTQPEEVDLVRECESPQADWIWCDDFEFDRTGGYFEHDDADGSFTRASAVGLQGSAGMRVRFAVGQVDAGSLKIAFGRTPGSYIRPVDAGAVRYDELFVRFFVHYQPGWVGGGGDKLARASVLAKEDWSQAMIAHLWSGSGTRNRHHLLIEPASGTDAYGNLRTMRYNDMANLRWLGSSPSSTPLFDATHVGRWYCIESRVKLNSAGVNDGIFELWIDGALEASRTDLNWVGAYDGFGINAFFLENYWNAGSPQEQERVFDNLVLSTERIGCGG